MFPEPTCPEQLFTKLPGCVTFIIPTELFSATHPDDKSARGESPSQYSVSGECRRENWRVQAEESENLRQDLAQQLESAKAQNRQLEERLAALEAEQKKLRRR